ncbi:hypothetical protein HDU98_004427 [Podochytrium sp. JEL0797]|nr:hypothetical protein HDU98_004427 [Podochytrium sp. JEL0797]
MSSRNIDMDALIRDLDSSLGNYEDPSVSLTVADLLSDSSALSGFLNFCHFSSDAEIAWIRRFFVLSKDRICQFASSAPSEGLLDVFPLSTNTQIMQDSSIAGNPLAFEIVDETTGNSWILSTGTKISKETWLDMISMHISRAGNNSSRSRPIPGTGRNPSTHRNQHGGRNATADALKSLDDVYAQGSHAGSPRRAQASDMLKSLNEVYGNNSPRLTGDVLKGLDGVYGQRQYNQLSPNSRPAFMAPLVRHDSVSSSATTTPTLAHEDSWSHYERDAFPINVAAARRSDHSQESRSFEARSFASSSDVGIRRGGVFGEMDSSTGSARRADSVKSDESGEAKPKKKSHHKAQMMKGFVQF